MTEERIEVQAGIISSENTSSQIEAPRDSRGRIRWKVLEEEPEILISFIEMAVGDFVSSGQRLTHKNLIVAGLGDIARGIQRYYPGDLTALEIKFGALSLKTPRGFWKEPNAVEIMRDQAREVLEQMGELSRKNLVQAGKGYLHSVICNHYPGKWSGLREDLGVSPLRRPNGYWSMENIEREAMEFFEAEGALNGKILKSKRRQDLLGAVQQRYRGGITRLRMNLGLELGKKNQYWTIEQIERESRQIVEQTGILSLWHLQKLGRADLIHAIATHYPGRITTLKKRLGINTTVSEENISPGEANVELAKLVEAGQI